MSEEIKTAVEPEVPESQNFIHQFIQEDIAQGGRFAGMRVHTRFPPEPNGYLHIGHCKALIIDFGTAEKFGGLCNLRMDDTNPAKEDEEYVEAIKEDIRWLGFDWEDRFYYASDYFDRMYECAVGLIRKGLALSLIHIWPGEPLCATMRMHCVSRVPTERPPLPQCVPIFFWLRAGTRRL